MRPLASAVQTAILICTAAVSLCAAAYHGVEVGQRDDFIPPEYQPAGRGEYRAQFGNELMQVFTEGAQVTSFKVTPLAPMTLAEAIAAHSRGAVADDLRQMQDFNGRALGIADVRNRIAYFTQRARPEAAIRAVGHYNDMTEAQLFTTALLDQEAKDLAAAAERASANAVNRRPRLSGLYAQAEYLVEADSEIARRQGQDAFDQLAVYKRVCSKNATCEQTATPHRAEVIRAASLFFRDVRQAERTFNANSALLENPPDDLTQVLEMADSLAQQIRNTLGPVQFETGR